MGKLHTLRRAIVRNPMAFIDYPHFTVGALGRASAAVRHVRTRQWKKTVPWGRQSYRRFVRHVLRELGYAVD